LVRKSASSRCGDSLCGESQDEAEVGTPLVVDMSQPLGDHFVSIDEILREGRSISSQHRDGEEQKEMLMDVEREDIKEGMNVKSKNEVICKRRS
jgi:hypothetical protein